MGKSCPEKNSSSSTCPWLDGLNECFEQAIEWYKGLLALPTVGTEPGRESDMDACLTYMEYYLHDLSFHTERWKTQGHPTLFASCSVASSEAPTVLLYGHYDVQPVDPLEEWEYDPFKPYEKDGKIVARGALDNKGHLAVVLTALSLYQKQCPDQLNIKLCIEGEEEGGSTGLMNLLHRDKEALSKGVHPADALSADVCVMVDFNLHATGQPAVPLSLRGIATFELKCMCARVDLHSGLHGGVAPNPNQLLCSLLAEAFDPCSGKVVIPGFYDNIETLDNRGIVDTFTPSTYREEYGVSPVGGEQDRSPQESLTLRPTLEINGLSGGYSGSGFKTIIPSTAMAKISCRLVSGQSVGQMRKRICSFFEERAHALFPSLIEGGVLFSIDFLGGGEAAQVRRSCWLEDVVQAYEESFSERCLFIRDGGSVPITSTLHKACGGDLVLMGFGLPEDGIHAPNESFALDRFKKGVVTMSKLFQLMGMRKKDERLYEK